MAEELLGPLDKSVLFFYQDNHVSEILWAEYVSTLQSSFFSLPISTYVFNEVLLFFLHEQKHKVMSIIKYNLLGS